MLKRILVLFLCALLVLPSIATPTAQAAESNLLPKVTALNLDDGPNTNAEPAPPPVWVGTWGTAQYQSSTTFQQTGQSLANSTLRQMIRVTTAGSQLRLTFSNEYGTSATAINAVSIAKASGTLGTSNIDTTTNTPVTFNGSASVAIPAGEWVTSDPVEFTVAALDTIAVSTYFGTIGSPVSLHEAARTNSFMQSGNAVTNGTISGSAGTTWFVLDRVDILSPEKNKSIVVLGDSITDGYGIMNTYNRWVDVLANNLQADPKTRHLSVINKGIGTNTLLGTNTNPLVASRRFERDVLNQPGVGYVVFQIGVNDLPSASPANMQAAFATMFQAAKAKGIKVFASTITPRGSTGNDGNRQSVNNWLRQQYADGVIDGLADFDELLRDSSNTSSISGTYYRDGIHPNDAGYAAMGNYLFNRILADIEGNPSAPGTPAAFPNGTITFNNADKTVYESLFAKNVNSAVEWVSGSAISHNGDGFVLKGSHENNVDNSGDGGAATGFYNNQQNSITFTLPQPLNVSDGITISYWVYVPTAGNEGKGAVLESSTVLNNRFGQTDSSFPAGQGSMAKDTWVQVNATIPANANSPINTVSFRFRTNDGPTHPDVWYIDDVKISKAEVVVPPPVPEGPVASYGTPASASDTIWDSVPVLNVNKVIAGTSSTTGKAQVMWDEGYLYVRVAVKDSNVYTASVTSNQYMYDSVEVFVDENNNGGAYSSNSHQQYRVSPYGNTSVGQSSNSGWTGTPFAVSEGYGTYYKIPWRDTTIPAADRVIGFDVVINDSPPTTAARGMISWTIPGDTGYSNANGFGDLTLFQATYGRYTAAADGGTTTADSSKITLTFYEPLDQDLTAAEITLAAGSTGVTKGALTKVSDTVYQLALGGSVNNAGNVTVTINKDRVEDGAKTVAIYKYILAYTAVANGTANTTASTLITLTFSAAVPDLAAADITFTAGSTGVTKGVLTKVSNTVYQLALSGTVESAGNVTVQIANKAPVDSGTKTVAIHKYVLTYTAVADGGITTQDSSLITLTFSAAVPDLTDADIAFIAGSGTGVTKGALTKVSDTVYTIALAGTVNASGNVTITIANKGDVDKNAKTVAIYKKSNLKQFPRSYFPLVNDPDFFTKMPAQLDLQDPFTFFTYVGDTRTPDKMPGTNGKVVTEADWLERREEIKDLMMYYWYGYKWDTPKEAITSVTRSGNSIQMTINNSLDPLAAANGRTNTWTGTVGTLTMPTDAQIAASPYNKENGIPVIISIGASNLGGAAAKGIATVTLSTGGYQSLYPYNANNPFFTTQSGSIMENAWAASRVLDAFEMHPEWGIDPLKSASHGVSINGKIAHMVAIWDDRVAVDAANESGGGGLYLDRGLTEGRINYFRGDGITGTGSIPRAGSRQQKMTNAEASHASTIRQSQFKANRTGATAYTPDSLPFDAHLGIALMAPVASGYKAGSDVGKKRIMLGITGDSMGTWIGPLQQELNMRAAKEVFDFLGSPNILNRVRNGSHATQARCAPFIYASLDYLFNPAQTKFAVLSVDSDNTRPGVFTVNTPLEAWHTPYEVDSSYIRWSNPKAYTLWTESEVIGADLANTVLAHSDAPQVKLTLRAGAAVASASWTPTYGPVLWEKTVNVVNGVATFKLSAADAKVGRYELSTVGGTKLAKSIYFQGIDAATALMSGSTTDNTNYNTIYGFTSKVNRGILELYTKASAAAALTRMQASFLENGAAGWITNYGAAHQSAVTGAFVLRKLQLEAMPGFTFEYSFSKSTHFLVGSQPPATWAPSASVQNIGPWPNWPVPGGLSGDSGTGTDNLVRALIANRTTNVLTPEAADAQFIYDPDANTLAITFATAMNPLDFAIGFDFADDFSLSWTADNKTVTVSFAVKEGFNGDEGNVYIARLRQNGSDNFINAPIHYAFAIEGAAVDKTALADAIAEAEKLVEAEYTAVTWAPFASALADAKAVLADEKATQEDVDAALEAVEAAADALERKPVTPPAPFPGGTITFTDSDKPVYESLFTPHANSAVEWISGNGIGRNDNYVLKGSHGSGDYNAERNAITFTLPEALPRGGVYRVSYWVYVPSALNAGKSALTGPGFVINGGYAGANGVTKFPNPGISTIAMDTWRQVNVLLPVIEEAPITTIDFRFVVNDAPNHADVWYIDDIQITLDHTETVPSLEWDLTLPSLYKAYEGSFLFGNVVEAKDLDNTEFTEMFKRHYNVITAGNAMKPSSITNTKGVYSYADSDKIVSWALANNIKVHAHTLVWHAQSPQWLTKSAGGDILTRAEAKANLEAYITEVAGHFKGKVISWDVVNEAFSDSGTVTNDWKSRLRTTVAAGESAWYQAYANGADTAAGESGGDYIYDAFVFARLADPDAMLYYNDYNDDNVTKSTAIAAMVVDLNNKWSTDPRNEDPGRLLVEGIGLQAHYSSSTSPAAVEASINRFIATGAKLSITELDITYTASNGVLSAANQKAQADKYANLFVLYDKYSRHIERVTVWGTEDRHSWRASQAPTLFDRNYKPKQAYTAVIDPYAWLGIEKVDKDELIALVAEAEGLSEADYTAESWVPFTAALTAAKNVVANTAATKEQVEGAFAALNAAISALVEFKSVNLKVTSDKSTFRKGDRFNITTEFEDGPVQSNVLSVTYTYDGTKFKYLNFTPAKGLELISIKTGEDTVSFTLGKLDGYGIDAIGTVLFSVKTDAALDETTNITAAAQFVYKDAEGEKQIGTATGSIGNLVVIPDPVADPTLIDLSDAIDFFGVKVGDAQWRDARKYDMNDNGEIDISDICAIAVKIK